MTERWLRGAMVAIGEAVFTGVLLAGLVALVIVGTLCCCGWQEDDDGEA